MEDNDIQSFVLNQLKKFDEKLSIIENNQLKISAKFEYLDDRLKTLECNSIHMDEKDLKASSEIKSGLNPIRNEIFTLKTSIRQTEVSNQTQNENIKRENEKNLKRIKSINKEIENVFNFVKEEKEVREKEMKEVKENILLQVKNNLG